MKFQDYGQVCHLQRLPTTDSKAFGLGNASMHGRVPYDRHQKLPVRMFAQLTESLSQAMSKSKAQPTIEQKILSRFSQVSEAHSLEDCLQFCLEQYTEKEQQLMAALQIGIQMQQILEGLQQVNGELQSKCADLEDQMQVLDLECRKLEVSNLGLEREIIRLRNANSYLEMECEAERHHRNEAIKEVLRETYESDKEEMDKMTQLVRALERDIERKEKRIVDQENERAKLNKEIKQSKCAIEDLTFENRKLKKQIISLSKQLLDLEKVKLSHAEEKSVQKQEQSPPASYKDRLNEIKEPNTFPKMILLKDGGPLLLEKNIIRKLNSKSAQKRKEEPETPIEKDSCFLQSQSGNSSAKKRRNIHKMKSMNHPCFIEDQAKSHQQTSTNEPINHIPASIRASKQDPEPKGLNDKLMYRVKSFQRLSQFSEAGRLSGALYNNLGEECEELGSTKKKEVKDMKSIGLMTQPNQEDQYIYSKDFESPMNSPLRRSPSPTRKFIRTNLHRSCLLTNGVIPEQKFFSAIRYNKNISKEPSKEEKSQGNASNFLASLVTRRTHKKKEQQSIMEIEERRKNEQKGRQRLSKSFIDTFKAIKQTLVPSTPSTNRAKREQKKYLSMSMINFEKESPEEKHHQKPQPNMKKKNTSLLVSNPGQDQKAGSSILDSLVNFTVKRRIKR